MYHFSMMIQIPVIRFFQLQIQYEDIEKHPYNVSFIYIFHLHLINFKTRSYYSFPVHYLLLDLISKENYSKVHRNRKFSVMLHRAYIARCVSQP